jgi:hypothetical protein
VRRWDKGSSSITEREIQTGFVKGCVMSGFRALVLRYFGGSRYDVWIEWAGGRRGERERVIRWLIRSVQFSKIRHHLC